MKGGVEVDGVKADFRTSAADGTKTGLQLLLPDLAKNDVIEVKITAKTFGNGVIKMKTSNAVTLSN